MKLMRIYFGYDQNSKDGPSLSVTPLEATESKKVYIIKREGGGRHVRKTDVEECRYQDIITNLNSICYLNALIYCLEKDVEFCKRKIAQDVLLHARSHVIDSQRAYDALCPALKDIAGEE